MLKVSASPSITTHSLNPSHLVSDWLDSLSQRVNDAVSVALQDASDAAARVIIDAGRELDMTIANIGSCYSEKLNETLEAFQAAQGGVYNEIEKLVSGLENKEETVLNEMQSKLSNLAALLPFTDKRTRLNKVTPQYIGIMPGMTSAKVTMFGAFYFAGDPLCKHELIIGDEKFVARGGNESLTVDIPLASLLTPQQLASPKRSFSYAQGVFSAPWATKGWFGRTTIHPANFNMYLGILPATVGTIKVTFKVHQTSTPTRKCQSSVRRIDNGSHHHGPACDYDEVFTPNSGWKYTDKDPVCVFETQKGLVRLKSVVVDPSRDRCVVKVMLGGGDWSNVGVAAFHLQWEEMQQQTSTTTREEVIEDMAWGQSRLIKPAENEEIETIWFKDYLGKEQTFFPQSDHSNPYLKLEDHNGMVILQAQATASEPTAGPSMAMSLASEKEIVAERKSALKQRVDEDLAKIDSAAKTNITAAKQFQGYLDTTMQYVNNKNELQQIDNKFSELETIKDLLKQPST